MDKRKKAFRQNATESPSRLYQPGVPMRIFQQDQSSERSHPFQVNFNQGASAPIVSPSQEGLSDWIERRASNGRSYYNNFNTGFSGWENPEAADERILSLYKQSAHPDWSEDKMTDGRQSSHDVKTNSSVMEEPICTDQGISTAERLKNRKLQNMVDSFGTQHPLIKFLQTKNGIPAEKKDGKRSSALELYQSQAKNRRVIDESGDFNVPSVSQDVKPKRETAFGKKKVSLAEQLNRKKPFTKLHQEQALELRKSIKHLKKIQALKALEEKNLTKVGPPLETFAADKCFSLGRGSMGTSVYVGILEDGSEVAVKRMLIESCKDAAENERNILSLIKTEKSPFIVSYRHFLMDITFMYLIVDLCEETLDEHVLSQTIGHLRTHGRRMIKEVLSGLLFLHVEGILHRDLKPSNILVDVQGSMKLADFGISRVLNENETTVHTDAKGTRGWMAPEVIETINKVGKGRFKKKSDIQPAGMIAFFILTKGGHPFGATPHDRMTNIRNGNPVNLGDLDDPDARRFVSRLISHKIDERPYADEALLLPLIVDIPVSSFK